LLPAAIAHLCVELHDDDFVAGAVSIPFSPLNSGAPLAKRGEGVTFAASEPTTSS
jgi:hypothetical protein